MRNIIKNVNIEYKYNSFCYRKKYKKYITVK